MSKKTFITQNPLLISCNSTFTQCRGLLERKNKDYAGLGDPFANFDAIRIMGFKTEEGILIRMYDKFMRIKNLLQREASVVDESLEDTINDLINYAAILKASLQRSKQ